MSQPAGDGVNAANQRVRPVRNKQVTAAECKTQQDIKQGEPVSPANHLGNFVTVFRTIRYHRISSSAGMRSVRFIFTDGRLQGAGEGFSNMSAL